MKGSITDLNFPDFLKVVFYSLVLLACFAVLQFLNNFEFQTRSYEPELELAWEENFSASIDTSLWLLQSNSKGLGNTNVSLPISSYLARDKLKLKLDYQEGVFIQPSMKAFLELDFVPKKLEIKLFKSEDERCQLDFFLFNQTLSTELQTKYDQLPLGKRSVVELDLTDLGELEEFPLEISFNCNENVIEKNPTDKSLFRAKFEINYIRLYKIGLKEKLF